MDTKENRYPQPVVTFLKKKKKKRLKQSRKTLESDVHMCQTDVSELLNLFWKLWLSFLMQQCPSPSLWCHFWPNTLKIDHFPSPLATQLERVSPGYWVQSWQWPAVPVSRASRCPAFLLLFLSDPKSELTPFTDSTDRPAGPNQSFTHPKPAVPSPLILCAGSIITAGPPSHSAMSNRKPAISNLTHFSSC